MSEMPPIGDLPLEDLAPMVAAWFDLLRSLSPRFSAATDRELTSAEETALRHLIKIGAVEVVLRMEFTNTDNEVQVDYMQVFGDWVETGPAVMASTSKPFIYRFVRARLTSSGQLLAAFTKKGDQDPQWRVFAFDRIYKATPAPGRVWPVPPPAEIPVAIADPVTETENGVTTESETTTQITVTLSKEKPNAAAWSPESLVAAFDRFYKTLDATTVPEGGGGRRIVGIAHAVALSEATGALFSELALAERRLIEVCGTPLKSLPAGIGVNGRDTPDEPWTPIPEASMGITITPIGGVGADAVLLAAIEGASKIAGFPWSQWNAMQSQNPGGNHQRWHANDVITAESVEVLNSVSRLLALRDDATRQKDDREA
ncbi:MAG: hypothetical protein K8S99_17660 [Planctomycetes bacterium]|nr:hypothetical protein [Planctomycetota bacterium]